MESVMKETIVSKLLVLLCLVFVIFPHPARGAEKVFAQFAIGGGYQTCIIFSTAPFASWSGDLEMWKGLAKPWTTPFTVKGAEKDPGSSNVVQVSLGSGQTVKVVLSAPGELDTGYIKIVDTGIFTDVAVEYFYQYLDSDGILRSSTGAPPSDEGTEFLFGWENTDKAKTAFAIAGFAFNIRMTLYTSTGEPLPPVIFDSPGYVAGFVEDMFPVILEEHYTLGSVDVRSASNINLQVMRMDMTEDGAFLYTSTPALLLDYYKGGD